MAYADTTTRSRTRSRASQAAGASPRARRTVEPSDLDEAHGSSYQRMDLRRAGILGSALAIGVLVGASAALLLAPQSGEEFRSDLADGTRRLRGRAGSAWDDLRDELRWAAHRGGRRMRRGITRGGWAAEDAIDKGRRKIRL